MKHRALQTSRPAGRPALAVALAVLLMAGAGCSARVTLQGGYSRHHSDHTRLTNTGGPFLALQDDTFDSEGAMLGASARVGNPRDADVGLTVNVESERSDAFGQASTNHLNLGSLTVDLRLFVPHTGLYGAVEAGSYNLAFYAQQDPTREPDATSNLPRVSGAGGGMGWQVGYEFERVPLLGHKLDGLYVAYRQFQAEIDHFQHKTAKGRAEFTGQQILIGVVVQQGILGGGNAADTPP